MKMPSTTTFSNRFRIRAHGPRAQRGVTLIELMIGIAIGLLVVAVAMAALMVSRSISGTVSDASDIQQQAAYAMRVLGGQLRQTSSLYLNLNAADAVRAGIDPVTAPVSFEIRAGAIDQSRTDLNYFDTTTPNGRQNLLSGTVGASSTDPDTLTVGFRRYADAVFANPNPSVLTYPGVIPNGAPVATLARDCLGLPSDNIGNVAPGNDQQVIQSVFGVGATDELRCTSLTTPNTPLPIVENVANFKVWYLMQTTATPGNPRIQYVDASKVPGVPGGWEAVRGVEVCLVLYGKEPINMPAGSTYIDCDGTARNMTSTGANGVPSARRNHMHLVFRNVFQLRSMGVM